MALSITQCKSGQTILLDGQVFLVLEVKHVKPGKGGAFIRTKLKNLKLGTNLDRTFKPSESIEQAYVEEKKLQYLYNSRDTYHFMDQETFAESILSKEQLSEVIPYLKDNLEVTAYFHKHELINVIIPNFINFKVIQTEPGIRGDTAKAALKPATIETGAIISVPLFINTNDVIRVDTREGKYIERA